jgi:excisionase family DNA binding protein
VNQPPADHGGGWLTLGEASRFLGVDESTLRGWADAGRVSAFRTPGGHRRFSRAALEQFLEEGRRTSEKLSDMIGPHAARLVPGAIEQIRSQRWYNSLDAQTAKAIGLVCQQLMDALAGYLPGGARQREYLQAGEQAGAELGRRVAALRLSAVDATEAFLFFKHIVSEGVSTRLPLPPDSKIRSLRRVDTFLNAVLLGMMRAFDHSAGE